MWGLGAQEGAEYLLEHFHIRLAMTFVLYLEPLIAPPTPDYPF